MVGEKRIGFFGFLWRLPFFLLALSMFVPYYWMLIGAFKTVQELTQFPPTLWVHKFSLNNFWDPTPTAPLHIRGLFQYFDKLPLRFGTFIVNSVAVSATNTVAALVIASAIAYVIAKRRVPGSNAVFLVILSSMMIPWPVTIIPNFLTVRRLGWVNTYAGLTVPGWASAFAVFFLRQYMLSVPDELIDAARIDGAGDLRTWWTVVMPLVTPALTAVGIFLVLGNWNNFVWPLIIAQDARLATVPVAMSQLESVMNSSMANGALMAGAMLASLPTVTMFLAFQRNFVESIAMTGIRA
ncbi:MAG: carbohydrate ABC transporter permease [Anaerolineae bacterium]|nr:carbohydrate ABC transporter permease [Anaerolineae bacterium]